MHEISINYLPFRREHFSKLGFWLISQISPENRKRIEFNVLTHAFNGSGHSPIDRWESRVALMRDAGIHVNIVGIEPANYMSKIEWAVNRPTKYSIKLDEDCFMNRYSWDFFLNNLSVLEDSSNLLLAPPLSNGIPTTEYFIEDFFDQAEKDELYSIFTKTHIRNLWGGVDYAPLNECIQKMQAWDPEAFYAAVTALSYHLKGIHPARVSRDAQVRTNEMIEKHFDRFMAPSDCEIVAAEKRPYFCNSFFGIKTELWRKIINDKSLFRDVFDEIPLNLYREQTNTKFLFIRKAFAIHTMYNTIYHIDKSGERELEFQKKLEGFCIP